jgi:uncharacterized membrane protein
MTFNHVKLNWLPVLAAVITAAVISGVWYSPLVCGKEWMAIRSVNGWVPNARIAPWKPLLEIVREFVVAYVLLRLVRQTRVKTLAAAAYLGLWVWVGFPVAMLVGASLWDSKPWELSLIHGGDWLLKVPAMAMVITATRRLGTMPNESGVDLQRRELSSTAVVRS